MTELIYDTDAGLFVSVEHRRIAEMVKDFSPYLELRFIPPKLRTEQEEKLWPFMLVDATPGKEPNLVMLLGEDEINASLIAKLFEMRTNTKDPMARMEAQIAAQRAYGLKEIMDEDEAKADFFHSMLKSPLNAYKHNGKVYR